MATPHDFTAPSTTEEHPLLQTAARLAGIVQSATDAIVVVDDQLRIVLLNAAAERMFGWPEQPIGSHIERFVAPGFRAAVADDVESVRGTDIHGRGVGAFTTFAGLCASGDEFPCEASITPYEVDGQPEFAIVIRDITERTRALLAAQGRTRDSEERFRLATNNVAAGVYTLDLQGLVTYVNPAAEAMFGWTMAELLGKRMHDVTHYQHPDGTPFPASDCPGLQVVHQGVELREQSDTFIRKDGTFFPVVYSASPLKRDGATLGIVVGFRDDAQHREADRLMRESEERFRLIASTAPVIIWMSDADQQGTYMNESWTSLTGLPQEAGLGRRWVEAVHPDDVERLAKTYTDAFDRRESFPIEFRLRRHDGDFRWVFVQGVPRYDARGSFAGYIGSAVDVTERKEAEELLSTLSQRLIEAQEQERSRLARELHDDINQRLAVLLLSLEIAMKRQGSPTELREQLGNAIETASTLASDVQSLSHRLHSSRLQTLGLERAAREVCREFSERSSMVIDFQSDDVADVREEVALCLYRVLQEALQNAVKHSGAPHIAVSLATDLNAIALTVQDSGVGFEAGKAFRGRGLGLVSMKERLKLVDGQLSIETRSPGGTTIRARVPLNHRGGVGP